jgi:hypothetical protein
VRGRAGRSSARHTLTRREGRRTINDSTQGCVCELWGPAECPLCRIEWLNCRVEWERDGRYER